MIALIKEVENTVGCMQGPELQQGSDEEEGEELGRSHR